MTGMNLPVSMEVPVDGLIIAISENWDEDDLVNFTIMLAKFFKKPESIEIVRDCYQRVYEIHTEAKYVSTKRG